MPADGDDVKHTCYSVTYFTLALAQCRAGQPSRDVCESVGTLCGRFDQLISSKVTPKQFIFGVETVPFLLISCFGRLSRASALLRTDSGFPFCIVPRSGPFFHVWLHAMSQRPRSEVSTPRHNSPSGEKQPSDASALRCLG